jgi:hypothetical protein
MLKVNINQKFTYSNNTIFTKIERPISSIPQLKQIWDNYTWTRILIWNGFNDIITPTSHSWQIVTNVSPVFSDAPAYIWKPCSGTFKTESYCGKCCFADGTCIGQLWQDPKYRDYLQYVCFKNSGHATPTGQPCGMQQLIKQWSMDQIISAQELPDYTVLLSISPANIKMIKNIALVNPILANNKLKELISKSVPKDKKDTIDKK